MSRLLVKRAMRSRSGSRQSSSSGTSTFLFRMVRYRLTRWRYLISGKIYSVLFSKTRS